jgi:hypothetical protein
MSRCRTFALVSIFLTVAMLYPLVASAQTGTISGTVRDDTGGVLPGVTVTASSPALIEGSRTAITDDQGIYRLVDLRLGEYAVAFTLDGFSRFVSDGVVLLAGATATVNADMAVGTVAETVTVTGASPIVDVQNATQQRTFTRAAMEELPTGRDPNNYVVLIPGVTTQIQNVGGIKLGAAISDIMAIHGSAPEDTPLLVEGMSYSTLGGSGGGDSTGGYRPNHAMVEELAVVTSGSTAEYEGAGVVTNVIMKQGANAFSGQFFGGGTGGSGDNFDDALMARGVNSGLDITKVWDAGAAVGGPIVQDKLWFYGAFRHLGNHRQPIGAISELNPGSFIFEPGDPANQTAKTRNENVRVTWQAASNSKLSIYFDNMNREEKGGGVSSTWTKEASWDYQAPNNQLLQLTSNTTLSNNLLLEVGYTHRKSESGFPRNRDIDPDFPGLRDLGTGIWYGAAPWVEDGSTGGNHNGKAIMTWVTGAHSLRFGGQWLHGNREGIADGAPVNYRFRNGVPDSLQLRAVPRIDTTEVNLNLGLFVQEQLTLDRVTLNLGVRLDSVRAGIPAQTVPAGRFVGERNFDAISDLPSWNDITPRLGVVFDLSGDGRTALKANLGKYMRAMATGLADQVNPAGASNLATTRSWNDVNMDFVPDCVLENFAANGECGPISSSTFGQARAIPVRFDSEYSTGWGNRDYNWEGMVGIQHEFHPGASVEVSYHRRWFGNHRVTFNQAVTAADFDEFCVPVPDDPRLPNSGQTVCGFFNRTPEAFGLRDEVITSAENFGGISQDYHGVDVLLNARLPNGILLQGGTSTGRSKIDLCNVLVGHPEITAVGPFTRTSGGRWQEVSEVSTEHCNITPPIQTNVKFSAVVPLPGDVMFSAAYQSFETPVDSIVPRVAGIRARYRAPAAVIEPSLGRPLSGGASSFRVNLVPYGEVYEDGRLQQVDLRLARNFYVGDVRLQPQLDIFNLFNANQVLRVSDTYGSSWLRPVDILLGRTLKFGVLVDF